MALGRTTEDLFVMLALALKGFEFRLALNLRKCSAHKKDMKPKKSLKSE